MQSAADAELFMNRARADADASGREEEGREIDRLLDDLTAGRAEREQRRERQREASTQRLQRELAAASRRIDELAR